MIDTIEAHKPTSILAIIREFIYTSDDLDKIKVCTAYELDGEVVHDFPGNASVLDRCKPVYEEIDGWDRPTAGISDFSELPEGAVNYINRIEELIGCKVDLISTGPEREETIVVRQLI